ncbi:glycosyltransferase [Effusibacillus dendaii]|uniref:Glycosyl transferase family 1 domain-containing protein n=1 Tax=Effusibacillus dendaii TaxID=2743772 RepID=A0A7I8DFV8_9BACL|nr:glycosyltransferase [Effusibacillus dendaii]BCJ87829.1 hypothetical protein skT53_28140 [Effusibacillus dendaii]
MCKKIVIAIISDLRNQDDFQDILSRFEEKNYTIHLFNDEKNELSIPILPSLVQYVLEQEKEIATRVVLLSNIWECVFAWYRCYNGLVNDFVYFIDQEAPLSSVREMEHGQFYRQLYMFNSIENEQLSGKIYLTMTSANYRAMAPYLLCNNRYIYFRDFENFEYHSSSSKAFVCKTYQYQFEEFTFESSLHPQPANYETVRFSAQFQESKLEINERFFQLLDANHEFAAYFCLFIYRMDGVDINTKTKVIHQLFDHICTMNAEVKEKVYRQITECLETNSDFGERVYFMSLLVKLHLDSNLLEKMMNVLLKDEEYLPYHYAFLINLLFYKSKDHIRTYDNFIVDMIKELNRLTEYYRDRLMLPGSVSRKPKRIAILVGQLLERLHSPTLLTLNYATHLRQYCPEYEIKIFVEDFFLFSNEEYIFPHMYYSFQSKLCESVHQEFLNGFGVDIYYSDPAKDRTNRLREDIEAIIDFEPEVLLVIGNGVTLPGNILYNYYPIIHLSLGDITQSEHADLYLGGADTEKTQTEYRRYGINKERLYCRHSVGTVFPVSYGHKERKDYGLEEQDFVMVTVGNRLNTELGQDFIDMLTGYLYEQAQAKWVICGQTELPLIHDDHQELLDQKKIIFIEYEDDLPALYRISDVYVDPLRQGGGYSGAMAMNEGIPVLTMQGSHVALFVGKEDSFSDLEAYKNELQRLQKDKTYYASRGQLMKERLHKEFSFEKTVKELRDFFAKAEEQFLKRKGEA